MPWRKRTRGQRGVRPPAKIRRTSSTVQSAPTQEAKVKKHSAERRQPETEGVEARKRHVSRANHQRDQVIRKPEQDGHGYEENHGRTVHGEHAIEHLWRDKI